MALDVSFHRLLRVKSVVANGAFVHLFSVVRDLVQLQHVVVPEALPADLAGIWFLPGVGPRVDFELFAAGEPFVADGTDVRFLPRVRPHVDDELPALDEGL